jgi:hypothetical protein
MKFEWLLDDLKGNHLLCLKRDRSSFFRGTLSPECHGKRFWQPFPEGEPHEVSADLQTAQRQCEAMVRQLGATALALG